MPETGATGMAVRDMKKIIDIIILTIKRIFGMDQYNLSQTGAEVQGILDETPDVALEALEKAEDALTKANSATVDIQALQTSQEQMVVTITLPSASGTSAVRVSAIRDGLDRRALFVDQSGTVLNVVSTTTNTAVILKSVGLSTGSIQQTVYYFESISTAASRVTVTPVSGGGTSIDDLSDFLSLGDYRQTGIALSTEEENRLLAVINGGVIGVIEGYLGTGGSGGGLALLVSNGSRAFIYYWRSVGNQTWQCTRQQLLLSGSEATDLSGYGFVPPSDADRMGEIYNAYECAAPMDWQSWCENNPGALFRIRLTNSKVTGIVYDMVLQATRIYTNGGTTISKIILQGSTANTLYVFSLNPVSGNTSTWRLETLKAVTL